MSSQIDILKHLNTGSRRVTELHVLKSNLASQPGQGGNDCGPEVRFDFAGFPEQFPDSLRCPDRLLELAVEFRELAHGPRNESRVEPEAGQVAKSDFALLQKARTRPEH